MTKIPSAEDLTFEMYSGGSYEDLIDPKRFAAQVAIEFAKSHVKAALENAYDCGRFKGWTNSEDENVHKELFVKNIMSRKSIE